jgi:hypothetical protein
MPPAKSLVYLVLGAAGSGRREILADLIEGGLGEGERAAVLLAEGEPPAEADARLPVAGRWRLVEGLLVAEAPPEATHVFFLADGRRNPVDQVEAFAGWVRDSGAELGRILCVVNCRLLEQHPPLGAWYEACLNFSDVALLGGREGVANKWLSDFREKFEKAFRPCLFELVKEGRVRNPALVLEPQARRVSHLFDEEWVPADDEEDEDEQEEGEEVEMVREEDPYLARQNGGRRLKQIPDIARFLDGKA